MGTLTPRQVSCPTEVSPLHVTRRLRPFCLQSPNAPHRGFHTLPLSSMGLPSRGQASPLACRLTGLVRPNRVRQTADWSLTSGCSPPRLSATQLPSVSRPESVCLERTCTSIRVRSRAHKQTILVDGQVAGNIGSWPQDGVRLVGYWIGKEYWGKGVATRALAAFLHLVTERPLHAHVAKHNVGSIRVLEKCGFSLEREVSVEGAGKDVAELVLGLR